MWQLSRRIVEGYKHENDGGPKVHTRNMVMVYMNLLRTKGCSRFIYIVLCFVVMYNLMFHEVII